MSKKNLSKRQKRLYGILLGVALIIILALAKGNDIKQVFNSLFPDGLSVSQTYDTEDNGENSTSEQPDSSFLSVEEDGIYSTPDTVAAYIHTFHKLPSNYITKDEAVKLGWNSEEGNLWDVTDKMSIGGNRFGNYEKLLPEEEGRVWFECDVNYNGGYRGKERIVYSNDGLIYYTDDHYESFSKLY